MVVADEEVPIGSGSGASAWEIFSFKISRFYQLYCFMIYTINPFRPLSRLLLK